MVKVINAWAFLNYRGHGAWAAPKSTPMFARCTKEARLSIRYTETAFQPIRPPSLLITHHPCYQHQQTVMIIIVTTVLINITVINVVVNLANTLTFGIIISIFSIVIIIRYW